MPDITTVEGLMMLLINTFSERFPQSAILKGGYVPPSAGLPAPDE